ncbi:MAG: diguanylate cyclase [Burkholderiales bacterium]
MADSPVAYALFDPQDRLRAANDALLRALATSLDGAPTWEQIMRHCHQSRSGLLIETDDIDTWIASVRGRYRQVPVRTFESDLVDGRWMWVTETLLPDDWLLVQLTDVSPLKANEASMRHSRDQAVIASLTDSLTGLHNRRSILRRLDDLLVSALKMRFPLSVVLLDLDHFKRVNDTHGHGVGDHVLQNFAGLLKGQVRPLDAAGRIGGEEFLLLLPNTHPAGASEILKRLRRTLSHATLVPGLPTLKPSFSAGVSVAQNADVAQTLLDRVDRALYAAKSCGRDTDVVIEGDTV